MYINLLTAFWQINILSCVTGSPTDYVAEWKSGSARRQNEKKKTIIIIINRLQSKNRASPMATRLINNVQSKELRSAHGRAFRMLQQTPSEVTIEQIQI